MAKDHTYTEKGMRNNPMVSPMVHQVRALTQNLIQQTVTDSNIKK